MHLLSVFSLRNRALIALVTIVVGVFGGIALTSLKQELIPSLSLPQVFIVSTYPGASPAVVDKDVSTPIESAIQGVAGLESTTATSSANVSSITAAFSYGTDIATAEQKIQSAINRLGSQIPNSVDTQVLTFNFSDLPVIQVAVTSDLDPTDLAARLESSTIVDLQKLDGVSNAALLGATTQRVVITPDTEELFLNGLSAQAIRDALDSNGVLLPAGQITEDGQTLTVQAGTRLTTEAEIEELPLIGATTGLVTIADVATVQIVDDPTTGISRVNGEPSVTIAISKAPTGNTVAVSQAVVAAIPDLEAALGDNTKFTVVFDQAPFIEESINSLATEGLLGLAFAVIVILIFLLSVRSTLVTAISIPASVLITFIGMQVSGYTLNVITLGALTISIGRVVDDSIVVIENIKRHLSLGETKMQAILTGVKEVAGAITASTVTTIAVFLPLALVGDITGELFRPFALTAAIALAASLFVSLTIVPVLAYWFLGNTKVRTETETTAAHSDHSRHAAPTAATHPVDELETPTRLQKAYLPIIKWTLSATWKGAIVLFSSVLLLGGTAYAAQFLPTNFIGDSGQNTLTVNQTLGLSSSLDAQDDAAMTVEDALLEVPGVETVQTSIGSGGSSLQAAFSGSSGATFSLTTDPDLDQAELQEEVRAKLEGLDDVGEVSLAAAQGGFASSTININITATTEAELHTAADQIQSAMAGLDVVAQATSNLSAEQPFIEVAVDRDAAAELGLSEIAVGGIVTAAMNPSAVGSVVIDEKTMSIYILNESAPVTIEELRAFEIPTALGLVPLTDLATIEQADGPSSITTIKGVRSATVAVTPDGDDVGTASAVVGTELESLELPAGATAELGGVTAQQADAFAQLGLALLVAILIVYVVMVATFRSLRQPLLLLVSVPFAATGAILLQLASGIPLGVASLIGVIMLIGVVVTNAIVLIDLVNQYRDRGMKVKDAVIHGSSRRLRPILMTAAATIFALLPLAMGLTGHGGFISQPLGIIVIGGLLSSTLLTLVVLPVLYYLVEGAKERREDRRAAKEKPGPPPRTPAPGSSAAVAVPVAAPAAGVPAAAAPPVAAAPAAPPSQPAPSPAAPVAPAAPVVPPASSFAPQAPYTAAPPSPPAPVNRAPAGHAAPPTAPPTAPPVTLPEAPPVPQRVPPAAPHGAPSVPAPAPAPGTPPPAVPLTAPAPSQPAPAPPVWQVPPPVSPPAPTPTPPAASSPADPEPAQPQKPPQSDDTPTG